MLLRLLLAAALPVAALPAGELREPHELAARELPERELPDPRHEPGIGCVREVSSQFAGEWKPQMQALLGDRSNASLLLEMFDRDGDGYIGLNDALLQGGNEQSVHNTFDKFDKDGDGKLSHAELDALQQDRKKSVRDHDLVSDDMSTVGMHLMSYDGAAPEFYYESTAYQQLLSKRMAEVRAAHSSLLIGSSTRLERENSLEKMFASADVDRDGKLSLTEYVDSGLHSRFDSVQGGFREAMDRNADGRISLSEARAAAAFEFDVIDPDLDGQVSLPELKMTLENKGWLRKKDWHVAQTLAAKDILPHLITSHVETHWGDGPEEGVADEELCGSIADQNELLSAIHHVDHARAQSSAQSNDLIKVNSMTNVTKLSTMSTARQAQMMTTAIQAGTEQVTKMLATDFCWIKTYDRGVGKIADCGSGYEKKAAMCYRKCDSGYNRNWYDIEFCASVCSAGTTDIGAFCRTNGGTRSKSCCGRCWPNNWCCATWCCGGCPDGYTNTGCFCEPSWTPKRRKYSPGKTMYSVGGCSDPNYPDRKMTPLGYFCYPAPRPGFHCQLTACQSRCPAWMVSCGPLACALTSAMCGAQIGAMAIDVTMAVVQTAVLVGSWGTAGAGANQGGAQAVDAATQNLFRKAAKQAIGSFKEALSNLGTRAALQAAIKDALKDYALETSITLASQQATDAIVSEMLNTSASDMDTFDFSVFDPSGISSAVQTTLDGSTDIDKAAAWTRVVGTVDPTGWISAAASFMKGTCDVQAPQTPEPDELDLSGGADPNMQQGLSGLKVGNKMIELSGAWRIGAVNDDHLCIGHIDGKTTMIFRSDGNHFDGPRTDWNPWSLSLGSPQSVTVGNNSIQIGSTWRIGTVNPDHLCIGHSGGQTSGIFRSDGTFHAGPRTTWNPWSMEFGTATGVFSSANLLQIGNFRIGNGDDEHLSVGHAGGKTSTIFRSDGSVFFGPRDDFNPWQVLVEFSLSGIMVGTRMIQIGSSWRSWRIAAMDDDHLSISHAGGKTAMLFTSDGNHYNGPRTDWNPWSLSLGSPQDVTVGKNIIQIGSTWRIGTVNSDHLCIGHSGGQTSGIFRNDGTFHAGPRTTWNPWSLQFGMAAGVFSSANILQIGRFRIGAAPDEEFLSVGNRVGKTSTIFKDDGNVIYGPRDDYDPWTSPVERKGQALQDGLSSLGVGTNTIQIGESWRIGAIDDDHMSIAHVDGKIAMLFTSDGNHYNGPRTDWNPWNVDFGPPQNVTIGNNSIQIGSTWRIGTVNPDHLCIGHKGGQTSGIFRSDGTFHTGPRTTWNPWSMEFGSAAGVFSGTNLLQIGNFRIGTGDDQHLSCSNKNGKTSTIFRSDGNVFFGPRNDYNPWYIPM